MYYGIPVLGDELRRRSLTALAPAQGNAMASSDDVQIVSQ